MMSTPRIQYATDLTDAQWQQIEPLLPAATWRLGGPGRPPAGSPPNRQRSFVFEQDGVSLGFGTLLFWAVENGV